MRGGDGLSGSLRSSVLSGCPCAQCPPASDSERWPKSFMLQPEAERQNTNYMLVAVSGRKEVAL